MPTPRLVEFLDASHTRYSLLRHAPGWSAQRTARSAHIKGDHLAKTLIMNADNRLVMVVLPASHRVDIDSLRHALGAVKLELASEPEFRNLLPDCEPGALPPFGNLYNMEVYLAECMSHDEEFTFCAGSCTQLIKMKFDDYQQLVQPTLIMEGTCHLGDSPPTLREYTGINRSWP